VNSGPKEELSILDFSLSTLTIIDYGVIVPVASVRPHIDQFEGGRRSILSLHAVAIVVTLNLQARRP
jgi:hypothetical protein